MPTPADVAKLKKLAQAKSALGALLKKRNLFESIYTITAGSYRGIRHGNYAVVGRKIELTHTANALLLLTPLQLREIDIVVNRELNSLGRAMVREAAFLAPAPATVPRVTVPSLAGREARSPKLSTYNKEEKKASNLLLSHLGKERMLLLRKNKFIDSSVPKVAGTKLLSIKQAGRRKVKSIITMHKRGTSLDIAHQIYMKTNPINHQMTIHAFKNMTGHEFEGERGGYRSTGDLKRSIKYKVEGLQLDIFSSCAYALEIEYGWGQRGKYHAHPPAEDPELARIVKFVHNKQQSFYDTKYKGARAQPFIYPAYLKYIKVLPSKLNNAIKSVLK